MVYKLVQPAWKPPEKSEQSGSTSNGARRTRLIVTRTTFDLLEVGPITTMRSVRRRSWRWQTCTDCQQDECRTNTLVQQGKKKITRVTNEERTHHDLWHAVHGNIQCIETIQTIVRGKFEQCKLNDLADGHKCTRFNNENDDESVTAQRFPKRFGIQGSCNIPPKVTVETRRKSIIKTDVPDSSGCESSNYNICDHWNGKHTLSPMDTRWYIRIWQEVLSNSTISGDFKNCGRQKKKKNRSDFNQRTSCSQDHEERNCDDDVVLIPHQEAAPKNNWVTTNNLDIHYYLTRKLPSRFLTTET